MCVYYLDCGNANMTVDMSKLARLYIYIYIYICVNYVEFWYTSYFLKKLKNMSWESTQIFIFSILRFS